MIMFVADLSIQFQGTSGELALIAILSLPVFIRYALRLWRLSAVKDQIRRKDVIVNEYKPIEGMTPAVFGAMLDNRLTMREMAATVFDLHARGIVKIIELDETDQLGRATYRFDMEGAPKNLMNYEAVLLGGIFGDLQSIRSSDVGVEWAKIYQRFEFEMLKGLQSAGYYQFDKNIDQKTYRQYNQHRIFMAIVKGAIKPWNWPGFVLSVIFFPFGIIWAGFAIFYYNQLGIFNFRTKKWEENWSDILGYYYYLKTAEAGASKYTLENGSGPLSVDQHTAYLVAAGLQRKWDHLFGMNYAVDNNLSSAQSSTQIAEELISKADTNQDEH